MSSEIPIIRVAAVFATMNRQATALQCVKALAEQIHPPTIVVVADNCSQDHTAEILESLTELPFPLHVLRLDENLGNAGGIKAAMNFSFHQNGVDTVWILDDDSFPRSGALEILLNDYDSNVVRYPLQIDPERLNLSWPTILNIPEKGKTLVWEESELGSERLFESEAGWTGALISREIFVKAGPVKGDLFIRGEDEEYPWRIAKAGFRFQLVRDAVLDHIGPKNLIHWRFLGKSMFVERALSDWKLYYKIRNMVWLKKQQFGTPKAISMALAYAIAIAWVDSPRRLPLVFNAALDGWRGKLGKWQHHL
jgi:rhamnopyranosyl-N-acetylglucosaminyl-diphospho-decaprenol beta-1,3/1,4-galactofuranosyltransferase